MSNAPFALSTIAPPSLDESDYDAILATVMGSERGRWFLNEFARRNRHTDTKQVIAAITHIETLIRDRGKEANANFRVELLDMAQAITEVRSEVAEIKPQTDTTGKRPEAASAAASTVDDIFSTVERIKDVAWTMRERGFDPPTCDKIDSLASALQASALRKLDDGRAEKLADVLEYLEHRIAAIIANVASTQPVPAQSTVSKTASPADSRPAPETPAAAAPAMADGPHATGQAPDAILPTTVIDLAIERMERAVPHKIAATKAAAEPVHGEDCAPLTEAAVALPAEQQDTSSDPLDALKGLSYEERIALCT